MRFQRISLTAALVVVAACGTPGESTTGGGSGATGGGSAVTGGGSATGGGSVEHLDLALNEVALSDGDFFELINVGATAIDLSGLRVTDLDEDTDGPKEDDALVLPSGTTLAPGALLLFYEGDTTGPSSVCLEASVTSCFTVTFGLSASKGDAIFVLDAAGDVLLRADAPANAHAANRSYGRLPDGTGGFQETARTPGLPNHLFVVEDAGAEIDAGVIESDAGTESDAGVGEDAGLLADAGAPLLTINEVALNSGDFVELFNAGSASVDLSGYIVADLADDGGAKIEDGFTLPSGTTLEPGGFLWLQDSACTNDAGTCFHMGFGLSLGSGDAVFVLPSASEAPVLELQIPPASHASGKSYGRIPDGTGNFVETTRTPGAANAL